MRRKILAFLAFSLLILSASVIPGHAAEDKINYNASGVVNRSASVDLIGHPEGFSAVLYNNLNGLPTSESNAIAETGDGFLWIGSYAGLIRYDGNTFVRMDASTGIGSVRDLYVDKEDRLWIGTNDSGVAVMERGEFRMWGKHDGMKSTHIRSITSDDEGRVYVATTCGIAIIDAAGNLRMMEEPELAEINMLDIRMGNDGVIYAASNFGDIMTIEDGKLTRFISAADNAQGGAGFFFPDPERPGYIYFESLDLTIYHGKLEDNFASAEVIDISPLQYVSQMECIDGRLWICAGNGVGIYDGKRFRVIEDLPMDDSLGHVMTDYQGNLWFTSKRQGVMKVVPNRFSNVFERFGIPKAVVNSTCMSDGKLFVATDSGLIVLDDNGPLSSLALTEAVTAKGEPVEADDLIELLAGCRIRSVIRDSKNRLWISTWRKYGLLCYDNGKLTFYGSEDGLLSVGLRSVYECEDGSILVAVTGGMNVIKDGRVVAGYGEADGIVNTESLTVCEGWNGDMILGSNGDGLYIINNDGLRNIGVEDGLPSDTVLRLKRSRTQDVIWIVGSSAIAYMTPDYNITTVRKFPYSNNLDLYENSQGDVWVLSSNGIYVTPAEELIANEEIQPVFYGIPNGLPCIATANSYSELTDEGDLYIAGGTCVGKVNIEQSMEDINNLKAVVPYVEVDGSTVYPDESGVITIPADTHKLTVLAFAYNYSLSDPQISYKLEGFDREFTTVSRSDLMPVDYTNLRGGSYTFVMQLKDSMGRGDREITVQIVKEKAFYERVWFYILIALVIIGLIEEFIRFYIRRRMRSLEKKQQEVREQFEQTAEALASAIDAKDTYTNGHSRRVAEYSKAIAEAYGMPAEECDQVYFAALLHDVGKIGVSIDILTKNGRLDSDEFEQIKQHPVTGGEILSRIRRSPWLGIGAKYHHERFDGSGYPEKLKGEEIPEIARIIAVADAYDAMTSNRSYRNAIPQHIVREELVKGSGTQFDPKYARIMIHMIDLDTEYKMKESLSGANLTANTASLHCRTVYHECTDGIGITKKNAIIRLCSVPEDGVPEDRSLPTIIVFDSLDGKIHLGEEANKNLLYLEYAKIRMDGQIVEENVRKAEVRFRNETDHESEQPGFSEPGRRYRITAVRNRDHVYVRVAGEDKAFDVILALPDTSRYAYISITGENCEIHNIMVDTEAEETPSDAIPRIAEEISMIKDCPVGDIPNLQVDGPRLSSTEGIPLKGNMIISFHTRSYDTARLVWHCPYVSIFTSESGSVDASDVREFMLLRFDGENWESDEKVKNEVVVERTAAFEGWETWKEQNRQGYDCKVKIGKQGNMITMETENRGIAIRSTTMIRDNVKDLYIALTGDQCAISDIHIDNWQ